MISKICLCCGASKELDLFHKNKSKKDGYNNYCKLCISEYAKKRYIKNKDYILSSNSKWRQNNKNRFKELVKNWRKVNADRVRLYSNNRNAINRSAPGKLLLSEWLEIKLNNNLTCLGCSKREPIIKLTIDHIIPLSKGGTNDKHNIQPLCGMCNSIKGDRY